MVIAQLWVTFKVIENHLPKTSRGKIQDLWALTRFLRFEIFLMTVVTRNNQCLWFTKSQFWDWNQVKILLSIMQLRTFLLAPVKLSLPQTISKKRAMEKFLNISQRSKIASIKSTIWFNRFINKTNNKSNFNDMQKPSNPIVSWGD